MPATPELVVLIGAGSIGQAIARRIGVGKTILLADLNEKAAATAAETLQGAGFTTTHGDGRRRLPRIRPHPCRHRQRPWRRN